MRFEIHFWKLKENVNTKTYKHNLNLCIQNTCTVSQEVIIYIMHRFITGAKSNSEENFVK